MESPLQITFHGIDHSDAIEERVREKATRLEQFYDRIVSCRVVVEQHHKTTSNLHRKGESFGIRIEVGVPGSDLVVKRDSEEHEDLQATLKGAFAAMERQVKDFADKQRTERREV